MVAVSQDKVTKSASHVLHDIAGSVFTPLGCIGNGLGLKVIRWLQDERLRHATIRELNRLNDDYLDDIGIKRRDIPRIVNAMVTRPTREAVSLQVLLAFACDLGPDNRQHQVGANNGDHH